MTENVVITLARKNRTWQTDATRVCFSVFQCFKYEDDASDSLLRELARHLADQPGLVIWDGPLLASMLRLDPSLRARLLAVIPRAHETASAADLARAAATALPEGARTVFIAETRAVARANVRSALPAHITALDAEILPSIALAKIPPRAWSPVEKHIYPLELPKIQFDADLDLLLMDCPARNLALMPNGLAYVHNALKKTKVNFQTFDLDIVTYHRYHMRRLFDEGGTIVLPSGREMPVDPWQAEFYDLWADPEVIAYFDPIIREAAAAIVKARPKILGLSIQQCNEAYSRKLVTLVREELPDLIVLVGGFSCYNAEIGLRAFPLADYMCVGESDLTVGPLVTRLARGERPKDLPGVLSRHDTPGRKFIPAPMPHNLDQIEMPRYEWCDLSLYRNFNGYQLVPVIASRGCRWSRCTFCAERFYWRIRSAANFVDELEWLVEQGCTLFMFNESDLNGMPEKLLEICDEIIRRDLRVRLTGQLRIHKSSDKAFFMKLREAGFVALRFGVDAFSENTVRLQKKGYTTKMISQNLKDCWESGIFTEVNWVIGVPGETDADCDEGVELILRNQAYIGRLANINPLILVTGSVYWIDPESHGIQFREPFAELKQKYPRALPADVWYSTEPFIDAQVRKARFEHIVLRLHDSGFPVGPWAERVIADVHLSRDRNRAGAPVQEAAKAEVEELPRLVRALSSHNIVAYGGRYYAIPLVLGNIDLRNKGSVDLQGVLEADNEAELMVSIEHARTWADSRGQYDTQARQRISGSLMKADSNTGDVAVHASAASEPAVPEAIIVPFKDEYVAVGPAALSLQKRAVDDAEEKPAGNVLGERTLLHRIVEALPRSISNELRSIWRARRHSVAFENGKPATAQVISVMTRGLFDRYVLARRPTYATRVTLPGTDIAVVRVASKGAQPNLLTTVGSYNLVEFDGLYYGLPHGLPFDWESSEAESMPGVLLSTDVREIMARLRSLKPANEEDTAERKAERGCGPAGELLKVPKLIAAVDGYNIVSYEGWVYGIPQTLGPIDLSEVDVIGLEGVIRDVSRDVVENEIHERNAATRQAAE